MEDFVSKIIEKQYKILSEIKRGGFGTVYSGWDILLEKPIAIKEILPELLGEAKIIDMFQDEAVNTAKLAHPNIVQIYNLRKTQDNKFYIIMEYVDGVDLKKLLQKLKTAEEELPLHLKAFIVDQVCVALDYAHNKIDPISKAPLNIVHRDVSPSNVMITSEGIVKLIDFGIAKARFRRTEKTQAGVLKGKIPYMSPEQILGNIEPDSRSDLFSLGIVFYELITQKRPFRGKSEFSIMESVTKARVDLKSLEKTTPKEIVDIVSKCLQKDIDKRYQNAHDMHSDIAKYLHQEGIINPVKELKEYMTSVFGDELREEYNTRLSRVESEEIQVKTYELASSTTPSDVHRKAAVIPDSGHVVTPAAPVVPEAGEEEEAEEKTIFDVIRLSRRNLRKYRLPVAIGLLICLGVFGYLDFKNGWTAFGKWIYAKKFPFALTIESVPSNAEIFIDGTFTEQTTPYTIPNISEGTHSIELRLAGFKPRTVSYVASRDKEERIPLPVVRFESNLSIVTDPPGATVMVNGSRLPDQTPCSINFNVGDTVRINLELAGFYGLEEFEFLSLHGNALNYDARFWQLGSETRQGIQEYVLKGIFQKDLLVRSHPASASISIDGEKLNQRTNATIPITVGEHSIRLEKSGFIPRSFSINVDKDSKLGRIDLRKWVSLQSYSFNDRGQGDLKAVITMAKNLDTGNIIPVNKETPTREQFRYYRYELFFEKEGYVDTSKVIQPGDRELIMTMRREDPSIRIIVTNTEGHPITQCPIYYRKEGTQYDRHLGITDKNGVLWKTLPLGNYEVYADQMGYQRSEMIQIRVVYDRLNECNIILTK